MTFEHNCIYEVFLGRFDLWRFAGLLETCYSSVCNDLYGVRNLIQRARNLYFTLKRDSELKMTEMELHESDRSLRGPKASFLHLNDYMFWKLCSNALYM